MDYLLLMIFLSVYLAMLVGRIPGLQVDRTGAALLGAIAVVVTKRLDARGAWLAIDTPTIGLLLGLMLISAQLELGGFYTRFTQQLARLPLSPPALLALVVLGAGVLSALLCNDIICLAMAPVLAKGCADRGYHPVPFLLALACSANIGSAATLIGNPQNMLIGQVLQLDFGQFLKHALPPTMTGLITVWAFLVWKMKNGWYATVSAPALKEHRFSRGATMMGLLVLTLVITGMLLTDVPREVLALGGGGVLLLSRRYHSRDRLALVDWPVLLLFAGLFVVNHATSVSGNLDVMMAFVRSSGLEPTRLDAMFGLSVVLSNLVSNVPATMLLLPLAKGPLAGPTLALSSTFAGNLLIVGSIANIIVVDQAERLGIKIGWGDHARVGVPITVLTLAQAAVWLWALS